ncbi:hypothetical protein QL093DRAFT_2280501 [Fusarium oxysporum]|jgi:hypothetical protein|nr:hypothetical protein QL093DRAFT_2280501 [Fusarium oxysporum]
MGHLHKGRGTITEFTLVVAQVTLDIIHVGASRVNRITSRHRYINQACKYPYGYVD